MKKLSANIVEQVYDVLIKFAEASTSSYERETFIYHYSMVQDSTYDYELTCTDRIPRVFHCDSAQNMWMYGIGYEIINPILQKIKTTSGNSTQLNEFKITKNEI